jgi:serine/threonine protein kinase
VPETETFEHFQVLRRPDGSLWELGRGAMGVTYKAFDTNLRCDVALKVINPQYLNSDTARQRFLREARAAAQLRHPNVATVFHLGSVSGNFFYAMEYVEGETVERRVQREGSLASALAMRIAGQVARALIAADRQKLVHRDIKPSNIMLVRDDDEDHLLVKVIDFGLAKSLSSGADQSATVTIGGFVGTPHFASPEQLEERDIDIRSDIYSLGATLWFMLTGQPPYQGSMASVIHQHLGSPLPAEVLARFHPHLIRILEKCLAKKSADRFQTPLDLKQALDDALTDLNGEGSTLVSAPFVPPVVSAPSDADRGGFSTQAGTSPPRPGESAESEHQIPEAEEIEEQPRTSRLLLRILTAVIGVFVLLALGAVLAISIFFRRSEPAKPVIHAGFVTVTTKPDGATVKSNGRELGKSPLVKYQLPIGKQVLEIESPGYQPRSIEATITDNAINNLGQIVLVREVGQFVIKTNPPGVPFQIVDSENKVTSGLSPLTVQNMPTGKYQVKIQRPGWQEIVEDVDLAAGASVAIQHAFQGTNVTLKSDPSGATIYAAGVAIGKTPLTYNLPQAQVELTSKIGSLAPVTQQFTPNPSGGSVVEFKHIYGLLSISADRADAEVLIGGISLGRPPIEGILPPGKHQVVVKAAGAPDQARTADIQANHRVVMQFTFGGKPSEMNQPKAVDQNSPIVKATPAQPNTSPTPAGGAKPTNTVFYGNPFPTSESTPSPSPSAAPSRPRVPATPVYRTKEQWEQAKKEAFRKFDSEWDARKNAMKQEKKNIEYWIDHTSGATKEQWKYKKQVLEDRMNQLDQQKDRAKDSLKRQWND